MAAKMITIFSIELKSYHAYSQRIGAIKTVKSVHVTKYAIHCDVGMFSGEIYGPRTKNAQYFEHIDVAAMHFFPPISKLIS